MFKHTGLRVRIWDQIQVLTSNVTLSKFLKPKFLDL